jgi:hypothetical protein
MNILLSLSISFEPQKYMNKALLKTPLVLVMGVGNQVIT